METVLVGAPGCGGLTVGRALAERHGASFVDLTGEPARRADAMSGLRWADQPDTGTRLRRVIAADRILADPGLRARLYKGRHVIWLDAPAERLLERLRGARRQDLGIRGDFRRFIADHLIAYTPYYFAGTRVDASGSIVATIAEIQPMLDEPPGPGTLILRAEIHGGLMELGEGILGRSLGHVLRRLSARRGIVVTSGRSRSRADVAAQSVRDEAGLPIDVVELPDGEPSKLIEHQEILFSRLARLRVERHDPLVAVGDDVLLEAATFAAAIYLRGVPLVTIPVTTLGMIDTSIGGKGGIDLPGEGRNLLGAIHQPKATILDIELVRDEPAADQRAAMAEAVKYGLIGDSGLLSLMEEGMSADRAVPWPDTSDLLALVERCALAKRRLVLLDERDTGDVRMALNLGHTLSHALEAATGYGVGHGQAVAYGLRAALEIGVSVGVTPPAVANRATRLIRWLGLAQQPVDVPIAEVLAYIESDKKRRRGKVRWVLVGTDGVTIHDDVPTAIVRAAVTTALAGTPVAGKAAAPRLPGGTA
jgi:3-dehydroquinate synthetase